MQNPNETTVIERENDELNGNGDAFGRLLARRPPRPVSTTLLHVGEVEDGADVDADEVEIAGEAE